MIMVVCSILCCTQVLYPGPTWEKEDKRQMSIAKRRCTELYKDAPCLVKFKKVEDRLYRAICGENNNE